MIGRRSALASLFILASLALSPLWPQAQKTPQALLAEAQALMLRGESYRAIDILLEATRRNASYADAWLALAEAHYELGEYARAQTYLQEAQRFGPRTPAMRVLEGFSLIGLGRVDEARPHFEAALAALPNDRDARFGLALLDLRSGRTADARARLAASLRLAPRDPRALLSLALITKAEGKAQESASYLSEALRWTADDPEVCYAAALLSYENGDVAEAARLAKTALSVKPAYGNPRLLLASIYLESGALDDARALLDEALSLDRRDTRAWYLLGMAEAAAGNVGEAEYAFSTLTGLRPDDEIARLALERLIMAATKLEDPSRAGYASYRFERAAEFERRFQYDLALTEYRRGLSLDPYANQGRRRYAELLRLAKLPSTYLAELSFLAELGKTDQAVSDALEIYASFLERSVMLEWKLEPLSLGSRPYSLAIYASSSGGAPYHSGAELVVASYLRDLFAFSPQIEAPSSVARIDNFADSFRLARESGADYYLVVRVAETERDVLVSAELRAARTGALIERIDAPRSGNDRVSLAASRIVGRVHAALPLRGELVQRKADKAVADIGRVDGVAAGDVFLVIKNGGLSVKPEGPGLAWSPADVVGRFTVSRVEDEISEGVLKREGFFDRMNPRDHLVREPAKDENAVAQLPAAASPAEPGLWTTLFDRVRSLY
jgi:tetratricopeptide (TPR) repeat protein